MVIKCEKCRTRFRLDDSRVTDRGVKVRCTKCRHIFVVRKEVPDTAPSEATEVNADLAPSEPRHLQAGTVPFETDASGDTSFEVDADDFTPFETPSSDSSDLAFEPETFHTDAAATVTATAVETAPDEVDFSGFDFGDSFSAADSPAPPSLPVDDFTGVAAASAPIPPAKETPQGLDFSDDDMFGTVVQAAPEAAGETISFDFEGDGFAESMVIKGQDSGVKSGALFTLDSSGEAPFSLGEIDFGDELTSVAVQQVNPEDLKPSQENLFAPLAAAQDRSSDDDIRRSFLEGDTSELPPLSISSRRKQSPLFGTLIGIIALLVISVLGYFGYSSFSAPKENAAQESGRIVVRSTKAAFVDNDNVGELLVISGEAVNEYPKPRAALQVKVTVFDAAGQTLATKSAYGGNPLTKEQLESLKLDKIEAAMANQFGDSLANMEVAPGKSIPFVVVLANLPKGARDFNVQSAGSTVAAEKQQ